MRYFYTDPLAAAWMAKHFGMRFLHYDTENECDILALFAAGIFRFQVIKLTLHPDSQPLLEPRVGDVAQTDGAMNRIKDIVLVELRDYLKANGGYRIIQRDGKAFHWPEVEK